MRNLLRTRRCFVCPHRGECDFCRGRADYHALIRCCGFACLARRMSRPARSHKCQLGRSRNTAV